MPATTTAEKQHWTVAFYQAVDSGDPSVAKCFAPDIQWQVGNAPASVGLQAMYEGPIGRNAAAIRSSLHRFVNTWDLPGNTTVVESVVTYHRRDGRDVTVPAMTVLHRNSEGLVDVLRLYIDTSPLFDGWISDNHIATDNDTAASR